MSDKLLSDEGLTDVEYLLAQEQALQQELKDALSKQNVPNFDRASAAEASTALNRIVARLQRQRFDEALAKDAQQATQSLQKLAENQGESNPQNSAKENDSPDDQNATYGQPQENQTADASANEAESSPSDSSSDQASDSSATAQDRQQANSNQASKSGNPPTSTANGMRNDGSRSGIVDGMPIGEIVVDPRQEMSHSGGANWGKLPQRLRDQMQMRSSVEFVPGYEVQTQSYFKSLQDSLGSEVDQKN